MKKEKVRKASYGTIEVFSNVKNVRKYKEMLE